MVDELAEGRQREGRGSKYGDEQREGQQIGQIRGMKGVAKLSQGQAIVEGKAGPRTGQGGLRKREGRRIGRRW